MISTALILVIIVGIICMCFISTPETEEEPFTITTLKERLAVIDPMFMNLDIRESGSSYTEDKTTIYLCIRDQNGDVYPMNTLVYVALHEIAHLLNKNDYGHTPAFHKKFDDLLCSAAAAGIYNPAEPHTAWYCGVDIRGITMPKCSV